MYKLLNVFLIIITKSYAAMHIMHIAFWHAVLVMSRRPLPVIVAMR